MYCAVGLWNSFFIILYSVFGVSRLMRWSTRSTEEIFAIFISIAFAVDASRDALVGKLSSPVSETERKVSESLVDEKLVLSFSH